jgi:chemotaxis protein MotB
VESRFCRFLPALLCLFLVLWLLASRNTERMQQILKNAGANVVLESNGEGASLATGSRGSMIERYPIPSHGETPTTGKGNDNGNAEGEDGLPKRIRMETPMELQSLARVIEKISAEEGLASNVNAVVTPQGLRLMLHDTDSNGMFERGSAIPSVKLKALLRRLGPVFAKIENQLQIVGHTDAWQYNDKGPGAFSNWALSSHRAMAARFHLLEGGMPETSVLQVSGMADQAPLDVGNPKASINRRIELLVLTTNQARSIAAMFGMPKASKPFMDGVQSGSPLDAEQSRTRTQLLPGTESGSSDTGKK